MKVFVRHITLSIIALLILTAIQAQNFTSSNLPIVVINTYGTDINNENPVRAKMKIIYHEDDRTNYLSDTSDFRTLNYNGDIEIKIRGNTSQFPPKKPYKIHTIHASNENNNVSLLGLPPENDWILNNIPYEPSYIRDFISYGLSEKIGNYAPRCRYCEVVIDGDYKGLYIFTEKMKADKSRIDIKCQQVPDNPDNDCAYIFKADRDTNKTSWVDYPYHIQYSDSVVYSITYPKTETITENQIEFIQNYYFNLIDQINIQNQAIDVGFPALIDIPSFIDFMLIGEFSSNVDIYQLSTYFHKDTHGKLRAGPVWDFNLTFGNDIQYNRSRYNVWQFSNHNNEGAKFWTDLFNNPTFRCHLSKRWHELTEEGQPLNSESVFSYIDETIEPLADAITRDCTRWNKTNHHASNIDSMKTWITNRINWMNTKLDSYEQCEGENVPKLVISRINYNPKQTGVTNPDRLEFIEITNNSDEQVNLTGIYFGGLGLSYVFPINSSLLPHKSAIICSDSIAFKQNYTQNSFGQYARHLSNQSQQLILYDAWGNLIDEVTYSNRSPWPQEANGRGSFLELIDLNTDNSLPENWRASQILIAESRNKDIISIFPNPFSDFIQIETNSYKTTYSIINAVGIEVLAGESTDNPITISTHNLPTGIYIIRITSDGETICQKIVKGGCQF